MSADRVSSDMNDPNAPNAAPSQTWTVDGVKAAHRRQVRRVSKRQRQQRAYPSFK